MGKLKKKLTKGINGNPQVSGAWRRATINDDPVVLSNKRGVVNFQN